MDFSFLLIIFLNGLAHGALLFLVASGLNLVLGVLRILNLAHGSLYMLGAYVAYQFVFSFNNFWLALILIPLLVAFIGIVVERLLLRQVYRLEITYQLLFTFALGLIISDAVKMIWGSYKSLAGPEIFSKSIIILGQIYPLVNIFVIGCAALILFMMWYFLSRTQLGWRVKATAYKGEIANALGINVPLLYTGVFGLGAFLSGLAGVI